MMESKVPYFYISTNITFYIYRHNNTPEHMGTNTQDIEYNLKSNY
jgi:hypothetical protein